ncbi:MAG: TIGR02147 family protein [Proteobacteria bacterium]|jgi:uncharacterized protein (TIGR02147 family)|nr:TIGR02147 family protein [Pseudomonadota bacterium]
MKAVFSYASYREFLSDHYKTKKKINSSYSFRFFAKKAGLRSGNYLKLVMDGERNLTQKTVLKFIKGLNLNEWEALYFENLVFYNQSKSEEDRAFYFKNMLLARDQTERTILNKDQYAVLSNWYPLVIKELGLLRQFELNGRWISNRLNQKISPQQAKEAIELLERLNLIRINHRTGKIEGTNQSLQSPDLDTSDAISNYHKSVLQLATEAVDQQHISNRCLSTLTVAVNKTDLPEAFKKIHKFRNEMDSFFVKGRSYDSVYQLAIQLFRIDTDV